jgi:hypothetical protein
MPFDAPALVAQMHELDHRLQRAEQMARMAELLGRQLAQHTIDHHQLGWLCGITNELQRLLAAAREQGRELQHELRCDRRVAA